MSTYQEDRRVEPRFPLAGTARLTRADQTWDCQTLDISLNGVMVSQPPGFYLRPGDRLHLKLHMGLDIQIEASVMLVYNEAGRVGCEFYDMDRASFDRLSTLIHQLYAR
jgi:hypothetical protein